MIDDKKMKLVKSENGINYYLFKPSIFSLYYNITTIKTLSTRKNQYTAFLSLTNYI